MPGGGRWEPPSPPLRSPPPRSPTQPPLRHQRSFRVDNLGAPGRRGCYNAVPGPASMAGTTEEAASLEGEGEEEEMARPAFHSWEPRTVPLRRRPTSFGHAGEPKRHGPHHHPHPSCHRHQSQAARACKVCLQPVGPAGRLWAGIRADRTKDESRPRRACSRCVVRSLALRAICCNVGAFALKRRTRRGGS